MDFKKLNPREVEAYLREQVRLTFGDRTENRSQIYAHNGYYSVVVILGPRKKIRFDNFRKQEVPQITKAIRSMKA